MRIVIKTLITFFFLFNLSITHANPKSLVWYSAQNNQVKINVDMFLSSNCSHCLKADAFFKELEQSHPWLVVNRYYVNENKVALQVFYELQANEKTHNFAVPAMFFCDSHWIGFDQPQTTGKVILRALNYCKERISHQGELSSATIDMMRQWSNANELLIGSTITNPVYKLIVSALIDAISPCSLFTFAAFLSFLCLNPKQKQLQLTGGIVFILALGIIHFWEQTQPAFLFSLRAWLRIPAVIVGLLLIAYLVHFLRKMFIGKYIKSASAIGLLSITTAIIVQTYQQDCRWSMVLVYEEWLTERSISAAGHLTAHLLYQFVYLLPLMLILMGYVLHSYRTRSSRFIDALQVGSWGMLCTIGCLLIIHPQSFADASLSAIVFVVVFLFGWLFARRNG